MLKLAVLIFLLNGAVIASLLLIEHLLEIRDVSRYMPGQTFAKVGGARVRYLRLGAEHSGATVVFFTGLGGSLEQMVHLQKAVAAHVPTLAYDRAGFGFSEASTAHTALEQANELADLLDTLGVIQPVVIVGYSLSAPIARVFAGRFPQKTGGMYLIGPNMPEINVRMPNLHNPRRGLVRPMITKLVASFLGVMRLKQRLHNWKGPRSLVEQRFEAALARSWHNWAVAQEWYVLPQSAQQALEAPVPNALPFEIASPRPSVEDEISRTLFQEFAKLVARSSRGSLLEMGNIGHEKLMSAGPVLDHLADRIVKLARGEPLDLADAKPRGEPLQDDAGGDDCAPSPEEVEAAPSP